MNPTVIQYGNVKKQETPHLTSEELNYVLETLLFSLSVNICADWDKNDYIALLNISKKIATSCGCSKLKNITFYEGFEISDDLTNDIKDYFKDKLNFINYSTII